MNRGIKFDTLKEQILKVTLEIEFNFPELYEFLDETPQFALRSKKSINNNDFEEYLNTITLQLKTFKKLSKRSSIILKK